MEPAAHGDASCPITETRIDPRIFAAGAGAILFDATLPAQPSREWFEPSWWQSRGLLETRGAGRGRVGFLHTPVGDCVLRHYHRGGMVAPMLGDRYIWNGRERTRSFAEFRLLGELTVRGLPVPAPIAARYVRRGPYYTADLITRRIARAATLADCILERRLDAALAGKVGALVARFHAQGVDHSDLNAHNVLVTDTGLALVDFDRGEIRTAGSAWKIANLARLKRSLLKLRACDGDELALDREIWAPLMRGYERAARVAQDTGAAGEARA
jgi:3-deoxy-D-manno-octulosonic acid kinase